MERLHRSKRLKILLGMVTLLPLPFLLPFLAVVLILGNFFAMPVHFYFYVWQAPSENHGDAA